MKVYALMKDETDYNGERSVFGVYSNRETAQIIGDWETKKAQDWVNSMRELGENVGDWIPSFYILETTLYIDN